MILNWLKISTYSIAWLQISTPELPKTALYLPGGGGGNIGKGGVGKGGGKGIFKLAADHSRC